MKLFAALLLFAVATARAASVGYVSIETDSLPDHVYLDAVSVEMTVAPTVVEAAPGKHFVSLFPPRKVYEAACDQAPDQFWDGLRRLGAIPDEPGLLSSYEAGPVRAGTNWVYVMPDDTVRVKLSHAVVLRTYNHDAGCVMGTFIGWTAAIGAAMVFAVILSRIGT
ncbi:MAG TPA: hypothetical protein VMH22_01110 [bacterium]|nr:hypothetical protein [bacterium]